MPEQISSPTAQPAENMLAVSPPKAALTSRPSKIRFDTIDYDINEGVEVLLDTILDPNTTPEGMAVALNTLSPYAQTLDGHDAINQIIGRYDNINEKDVKASLIRCLGRSGDGRTIPFLDKIIKTETDPYLLTTAAGWLASWNIRAGVEKLIALLDAEAPIRGNRGRPVYMEVGISLSTLDKMKNWGGPINAIGRDIKRMVTL